MSESTRNPKDQKPKPGRPSRLLTVPEAAAYLRVSDWTIYKLVRAGDLPVVHVGRGFLIDARDLDDFIDRSKIRGKS